MSSATNFGVTLTSDRLHPRNLFIIFMLLLAVPDFTSRSCQTKRYAMLGWQLSYFINVCTVQLDVSFSATWLSDVQITARAHAAT